MADAENALPPSKKRAAGRELTRDTPNDDDECTPEVEAGTFKRASDEVLASRRIVKVRRQQTNSAPSSNPFAGIRLVAPPESNANPVEATAGTQVAYENAVEDASKGDVKIEDCENPKDEEDKQPEGETHEAEDKSAANKDAAEENSADKEHVAEEKDIDEKPDLNDDRSRDGKKSESADKEEDGADKEEANDADKENANNADKEQQKGDNDPENDDKKENSNNNDKKDGKLEGEEPSTEGSTFKSFQQLSSSQNAFTGLAGIGFTTSLFSFGKNAGPVFGSGSGPVLGQKNDKTFGLGLFNNGSFGFGASGPSLISKSEGSGLALQEVPVETGEENEKVVFNTDSVLFEFTEGSWKERGKGELKVNVNSGTEKARILMRARGNYRLILNARLYPDMKLTSMEKKGVSFACINSATEGKYDLSTFALKFKDESIVEEFKSAIMEHKGDDASTNTSENSPKASV